MVTQQFNRGDASGPLVRCRDLPMPPADVELTGNERRLLDQTNEARTEAGLPPLRPNPLLMGAARRHAQHMAWHDEFSHNLDGAPLAARVEKVGYAGRVTENLTRAALPSPDSVPLWMAKPDRRANMFDPAATDVGFGSYLSDEGNVLRCAIYGRPNGLNELSVSPPLDPPRQQQSDSPGSRSSSKLPVHFRFVSESQHREWDALLPRTEDPALLALYAQRGRFIWYTDKQVRNCYQASHPQGAGFHDVLNNFSGDAGEPFGHANREFPWAKPAGTDKSTNVEPLRFVVLPLNDNGREWPIVFFREQYDAGTARYRTGPSSYLSINQSDEAPTTRWVYPAGTVLGEVGLIQSPRGTKVPFQLNTLTVRSDGGRTPNQFRPFTSPQQLAAAIEAVQSSGGPVAKFVSYLKTEPPKRIARLSDDNHNLRRSFDQTYLVDELPDPHDYALIEQLMRDAVWESTQGRIWREVGGVKAFAPTTKAAFNIVPNNFTGGAIAMTEQSCNRCHQDTHHLADEFQSPRDWYGHVRGDNGVFSMMPVERQSLCSPSPSNSHGFSGPPTVRLRQDMLAAGVMEKYDPAKHPASVYSRAKPRRSPATAAPPLPLTNDGHQQPAKTSPSDLPGKLASAEDGESLPPVADVPTLWEIESGAVVAHLEDGPLPTNKMNLLEASELLGKMLSPCRHVDAIEFVLAPAVRTAAPVGAVVFALGMAGAKQPAKPPRPIALKNIMDDCDT